jgi:hypothetical protein
VSEEPLEPPDEHHWWEMQLGLRLPRSIRHPSPIVRLDPHAKPARAGEEPPPDALSPADERHWWEHQLGKKVGGD